MALLKRLLGRIDRLQRGNRPLGFLFGVHRRFTEDRGGHYAALVAYFGFLSIFPLMVALTNILGLVLKNRPRLRERFVESAAGKIPVVGDQLKNSGTLSGSTLAIVLGVLAALWAGLKAIDAIQHAYDTMWGVPETARPNFFLRRALALLMVAILGGGTVAATVLTSIGAELEGHPTLTFGVTALGTTAINALVLVASFEVLTNVKAGWRNLWLGAVLGGIGLSALQIGGNLYATRVINNASPTYGAMAGVIGLLAWFSIQARLVLYAFEVNVVWRRHLWPRGLQRDDPTPADRRARDEALARLG